MTTMENNPEKDKTADGNLPGERHGKFGYFGFTPSCLQWLNNPWSFLVGIFGLTVGQALAVIGLLAVVMPQVEKRFNLSSFDVGMIAASNDFSAVILGLIVAHYGNYGNKVKWIGIGGIVTGIGLIIFTLPHYIIEKYEPPPASLPALLCTPPVPPPRNATITGGCDEGSIAEWYYLAFFLIGQFVSGVGSIALFSFAPVVFQDCVSEKNIPFFIGVWQSAVFIGPMLTFGLSEPLLELYVDIDQPEGLNLTPQDPRWIGNWWVGFLGAGAFCIFCALFLLGFPRNIKCQKGKMEIYHTGEDPSNLLTLKEKLADFPSTLKNLLTNWTFVFNSMGQNCILIYVEGLAPFLAKILMLNFGVPLEDIGRTLIISAVPPLIVGVVASSFLTRAFKLEESGKKAALTCFLLLVMTLVGPASFQISGCDEINLAGWNVPYGRRHPVGDPDNFTEHPAIPGVELGSTCNANCSCHLGIALPVCGSDNVTYLSPCYAGCAGAVSMTKFGNCSCIASKDGIGGTATIGFCVRNCKNWLGFLVLVSFVSLGLFALLTPSKFVLLRCVRPKDLSFAFGLQYFSTKIFAHIPGPILFGHIVDLNCAIWQKVCEKTGYCWIYDIETKMKTITIICGTLAGTGVVFYFLSWLFYKEAERPSTEDDKTTFDNVSKYTRDTKM